VSPSIQLDSGIRHLYDINYLYGCSTAAFLYWLLSRLFPTTETLLAACIYEDDDVDAADVGKHAYSTMDVKDDVEVSVTQQRS
jgi:NCS1 family nucleobase:cation symporter-1